MQHDSTNLPSIVKRERERERERENKRERERDVNCDTLFWDLLIARKLALVAEREENLIRLLITIWEHVLLPRKKVTKKGNPRHEVRHSEKLHFEVKTLLLVCSTSEFSRRDHDPVSKNKMQCVRKAIKLVPITFCLIWSSLHQSIGGVYCPLLKLLPTNYAYLFLVRGVHFQGEG